MTEPTTVLCLPSESDAIEWLEKAQSKDRGHPQLQVVSIQGDITVSSDGHRLHAVETPDSLKALTATNDRDEANYEVSAVHVTFEPAHPNVRFPALKRVIPEDEPTAQFYVNPRYLIEALQGFLGQRAARIRFYMTTDDTVGKITIDSADDSNRYALIMCVYSGPSRPKRAHWKPDFT